MKTSVMPEITMPPVKQHMQGTVVLAVTWMLLKNYIDSHVVPNVTVLLLKQHMKDLRHLLSYERYYNSNLTHMLVPKPQGYR